MIDPTSMLLFSLIGFSIGFLTSLIPGLHINTTSLLIISLQATFYNIFDAMGVDPISHPLLLSILISSAYVSSTFSNVIPAILLGAPDEDTALSILPGHSLLLKGRGYEAIVISAFGSFGSALIALSFLYPFKLILTEPLNLYDSLLEIMPFVLVSVVAVMILTERGTKRMAVAILTLILSGIYGILILDLPIRSPISLPSSPLFPALAGLFGMATLVTSAISRAEIGEQSLEEFDLGKELRGSMISMLVGSLSGILVSIIPGVTTAIGTIIALTMRGEADERQTLITLSSVNTSVAIFAMANIFTIGRARSGVAIILKEVLEPDRWIDAPPPCLIYLLIPIILSSSISFLATCRVGKLALKGINRIPYQKVIRLAMVFLIFLILLFSGLLGLLIFAVGTLIGMIPILMGARRSNCMGVLIIPLFLRLLGIL
ncbi:MAG: hypothetical protein DRN13_01965 [Thermoplasmata archaeon]|nr:MAG: hypothetical protein DRN13_01965 [Thermoplasmata archaeon]